MGMPYLKLCAVAAVLLVTTTGFARAHSIGEVEEMLGEEEKYFQTIDKPAPDFTLRTADDHVVRLADLRGKGVVLNFVYTSCPDICPLHAERIAEIQRLIKDTPMRDRVAFVTVTTDPSTDTPDVMRDYGAAHGLDPANWTFLTTTQDEPENATRKLAEAYGHKFAKTEDGYQMHGIVTHIIDGQGVWKANFHGLQFDPVNMVTFVNALTNDTSRPHPHPTKSWWDWITE
jgi:protein SCO1/2